MAIARTPTRARSVHFDTVRDLHYAKPLLRGWSHLAWFGLCLVFGPWAIAWHHGATRELGLTIYVLTVAGLFGTSALYHCGTWSPASSQRLQRLDHVMIFFMIAGTATPAFLLALPGRLGLIAVVSIWTMVIGLAAVHLCRMQVPEKVVGAAFLLVGWTGVLVIPAVWLDFGATSAVLLLAGGLLYTAGALSYHRRTPDPIPTVFGYHEVFHAFVCAAATCQFVAIVVYIA